MMYQTWIDANVPIECRGWCHHYAKALIAAFPELRLVRGWFHTGFSSHTHWWCATPDNQIVDPTRKQFSNEVGYYVEFREGIDPEPIGKCLNCGAYVWKPQDHPCPTEIEEGFFDPNFCNSICLLEMKCSLR